MFGKLFKKLAHFWKPLDKKGEETRDQERYYRRKRYIMEFPLYVLAIAATAVCSFVVASLVAAGTVSTFGAIPIAIGLAAAIYIPHHYAKTSTASYAKGMTARKFNEGHKDEKDEVEPDKVLYIEKLDYLTQKVSLLEERLSLLEERLKLLSEHGQSPSSSPTSTVGSSIQPAQLVRI